MVTRLTLTWSILDKSACPYAYELVHLLSIILMNVVKYICCVWRGTFACIGSGPRLGELFDGSLTGAIFTSSRPLLVLISEFSYLSEGTDGSDPVSLP
jgi:hypothetical protein